MFVHEWLALGADRGCIDLVVLIVEVAGTAVSIGEPGEGMQALAPTHELRMLKKLLEKYHQAAPLSETLIWLIDGAFCITLSCPCG